MMNPVGWFEINVADMTRAQRFYETVLGCTLEDMQGADDPTMELKLFPSDMESYGAAGALLKMIDAPVGQNSVLVYFSCDDCAQQESRVVAAGGQVERSKFSIGEHGFIVMAEDTEGNVFGLHSMK